ncbi:hypothetical protein CTI12_AA541500 [Artemisia annua]|uniref:Uncharacterized protein n=1 Tax=Artemisia annua TaxID=35608 RepID=A0A2U1L190_ARTAN|nr:hypothetical protein CTI12_AA541500 [Artemisia annua]
MADKEITIVTKNDSVSTNPLSAVFSKFSEGFNNLPLPFKFPMAKKVETERKATVYAVGGFFVLKWAWGRWNERRERKKSSNEDPPSSSPTVDENN